MTAPRQCWICLEEDAGLICTGSDWLQPCACRGSTGWVHASCLLLWIDSQQGDRATCTHKPACPKCGTVYRIVEDRLLPAWLLHSVDMIGRWKEVVLMGVLVGSLTGSFFLASWSYGALTLVTVLGPSEAYALLTSRSAILLDWRGVPFQLVVRAWNELVLGVSLIPVAVLSNRFSRVLAPLAGAYFLSDCLSRPLTWTPALTLLCLPYVQRGYTSLRRRLFNRVLSTDTNILSPSSSSYSLMRLLEEDDNDEEILEVSLSSVAALLIFPAASSLLGWALLRRTGIKGLNRTLIGGAILSVALDAGRLLYSYQAAYTKRSRRILDYNASGSPSLADLVTM